jgi:regulator of cell morphogenesis and NO signaling
MTMIDTKINTNTHSTAVISAEDTLNLVVERYPQALAVLQHFGLDTCCGGALPLSTAAQHHDLDVEELLSALRAAIEDTPR